MANAFRHAIVGPCRFWSRHTMVEAGLEAFRSAAANSHRPFVIRDALPHVMESQAVKLAQFFVPMFGASSKSCCGRRMAQETES